MHATTLSPASAPCPGLSRPTLGLLPLSHTFTPRARGIRVMLLLFATMLLCLGDLWMTLTYVTTVGLYESNPIARIIMSGNSTELLIGFKLGTMLIGGVIMFCTRRHRMSELAAWACCLVMTWLAIHWANYSTQITSLTPDIAEAALLHDERFVLMTP